MLNNARLYSKRAFTLIELMLTVAIIGILAAIAYPQFAQLTRKAWEGKTKANLGVIRSALSIYYGDEEGIYPTDNLASLIPRYLASIPMQDTRPYHQIGNDVGNGDAVAQQSSRNSWFYYSVPGDPLWGKIIVNCDHQDLKGQVWSSY